MTGSGPDGPAAEGHPAEPVRFVVCGGNALAVRLTQELVERHGGVVTVITRGDRVGPAAEADRMPAGEGVIVAPRLSADVFRQAGLAEAVAVALVDQDDVANLDAALIAREIKPGVRIVARMFSPALAEGVTAVLPDVVILSASEIAAPAFVAAAMGERAPAFVRLPGRLLQVAERGSVHPADILCGLATAERRELELLPAEEDADLVLADAHGSPPRPRRRPSRATRLRFDRNLKRILAGLVGVLLAGTVARAVSGDQTVWEAGYLAVLAAFGGADPDPGASWLSQLSDILLVLAGVALVPAITAAVVEMVVRTRLTAALGGTTEPVQGHVVVVGLGNVGTRVVRELHDFGIDVVGVDLDEKARGVDSARELGIPVVIGDGRRPEVLRSASVQTCRTLVVVSVDDLVNLEIALSGRALRRESPTSGPVAGIAPDGELRVVLRLFDAGMADRVTTAFDVIESRSVSYLAAPAFAAAMAGPQVIDTIAVGRHVLLVTELPVGAGSALDGRRCAEVDRPNAVRLVGVRTGRGAQTLWRPPPRRRLVRTDQLLVVATRAGLAELTSRVLGVPNPAPMIPDIEPPRARTVHSPEGARGGDFDPATDRDSWPGGAGPAG